MIDAMTTMKIIRNKHTRFVLLLLVAPVFGATFSNISVASESSDHGRARVTANVDTDGFASVEWGAATGPANCPTTGSTTPCLTTRYVTASPSISISGGSCTTEPVAYVLTLASGGIGVTEIVNPGSGCSGTPTLTVSSVLGGSGAVLTPVMSGGALSSITVSTAGSGYALGPGGGTFNSGTHQIAAAIGGLAPSTTYYYVILLCPDASDNTGCSTSAQQTFTTAADPGHPVMPATISPWFPAQPNLSTGYTVVPLTGNGAQECFAASNVGPVTYGGSSWSVTAGDTLTKILTEVGFGARIQAPQGLTCYVPDTAAETCGYTMPSLAADPNSTGYSDPAHRYIVIETAPGAPTDSPPWGYQIGPSWHGIAKLANFQAQAVCGSTVQAEIAGYESDGTHPANHILWQNVQVSLASGNGPWDALFVVGFANTGRTQDIAFPPSYNIFSHVYFAGATSPVQVRGAIAGTPNQILIDDSYFGPMDCLACVRGVYFTTGGGGPVTINNTYFDARFQGIYIEKNNADNCNHLNSCAAYGNVQITKNFLHWPLTTLNNPNWSTGWDGVTRQFRNQIEFKTCRVCLVQGNTIDGQWSYQNEGSAVFLSSSGGTDITGTNTTGTTDVLVKSNIIRNSAGVFDCLGSANLGNTGPPDEAQNARDTFENNMAYFLGRFHYSVTGGSGGLNSSYMTQQPGCEDLNLLNNTLGFDNADFGTTGNGYIPTITAFGDGQIQEGFWNQNNLFYLSQGQTAGETGISNDTSWQSACSCYGGSAFFPLPNPGLSSANPSVILAAASVRTTAAGVAAYSQWGISGGSGANLVICGNKYTGAEPWPDQSSSDCTTNQGIMPTGDVYPSGSTMAARETAAGFASSPTTTGNFTCTASPCMGVGANIATLENDAGIVRAISVVPTSTSITVSYTAPDTTACAVDSSQNAGTTWNRTTASGGSQSQSITVTGLTPSTATLYRLMCYSDQSAATFSFPSEATNMATDGSASTTSGSSPGSVYGAGVSGAGIR